MEMAGILRPSRAEVPDATVAVFRENGNEQCGSGRPTLMLRGLFIADGDISVSGAPPPKKIEKMSRLPARNSR